MSLLSSIGFYLSDHIVCFFMDDCYHMDFKLFMNGMGFFLFFFFVISKTVYSKGCLLHMVGKYSHEQ